MTMIILLVINVLCRVTSGNVCSYSGVCVEHRQACLVCGCVGVVGRKKNAPLTENSLLIVLTTKDQHNGIVLKQPRSPSYHCTFDHLSPYFQLTYIPTLLLRIWLSLLMSFTTHSFEMWFSLGDGTTSNLRVAICLCNCVIKFMQNINIHSLWFLCCHEQQQLIENNFASFWNQCVDLYPFLHKQGYTHEQTRSGSPCQTVSSSSSSSSSRSSSSSSSSSSSIECCTSTVLIMSKKNMMVWSEIIHTTYTCTQYE